MAHIHEKVDYTTTCYIVHDNKVLLRMHDKYGVVIPPGGHVELDEDPTQSVIREVREETGLEIELVGLPVHHFGNQVSNLLPPIFMNRMFVEPGHEHIDLIYVARAKTTAIQPGPNEADVEMKWYSMEDLNNPANEIQEHAKYYALQALTLVG
jgi:ADP-ribose pyrophosphatase YjhB (NUDIX family)